MEIGQPSMLAHCTRPGFEGEVLDRRHQTAVRLIAAPSTGSHASGSNSSSGGGWFVTLLIFH